MECIPHRFHFVNMRKTWTEAKRYCGEGGYAELAAINDMEDMQMLMSVSRDGYEESAWIRLPQTSRLIWKWSLAHEGCHDLGETNFSNWNENQPDGYNEKCVEMQRNGKWNNRDCAHNLSFVCYNGENYECVHSIRLLFSTYAILLACKLSSCRECLFVTNIKLCCN